MKNKSWLCEVVSISMKFIFKRRIKSFNWRALGLKEKARSQYETTDDAIVVDAVNGRIFEYAQHLRGMDRFFMDMEPEKLKEDFGDKAVFHGAIDQGKILREATAAEIEGELNGKIKELAHSGGDILALAHTIEEYTLVEDLMAMYDFAKKCGQYPVRY